MAAAAISVKKADLKKVLCAAKIKSVKAKSLLVLPGDKELLLEVDFKNPADLYELGKMEGTLTGTEYPVDELITKLTGKK